MPDLAPCYVATQSTLIAGWNAASIEHALNPGLSRSETRSSAVLYLDRLPEADARLARATRASELTSFEYPWTRIEVSGRRDGDRYRFELTMTAEGE